MVDRRPGTLHLVPTPLGNPEDITLRALRVLREVDLVAAEDTRVALQLFRQHGITARLLSVHDHNEAARAEQIVERLRAGESVALLSDAGTPLVNDPGFRVVRATIDADLPIDVLPGPCAAIAALVGSGLPVDRFCYGGFLPREEGPRRAALAELAEVPATLIFYESPLRLAETLATLAEVWPDRPVCVARNLTKAHEQWIRGTAAEARATLGNETRGEVVLLVGRGAAKAADAGEVDAEIDRLLAEGLSPREVRDRVAERFGLPRRDVYQRALDRKR